MSAAPLRIGWAGPLKSASAIGRVGVRVAEALAARGHEVELIGTDHEPEPAATRLASELPVRHWAELELAHLAHAYDSVVVNVGDHLFNHAGAFPLLGHAPCLAIMHDFYLGNLFNGWLWANGSVAGAREAEVVATYGPQALDRVRRQARGELPLAEEAAAIPMTEWIARKAAGCLAHAPFYVPRLLASCAGPVDVAGLPVASRGTPPLPERRNGRLTVLTVGHMNPNKCADSVVEAVAGSAALRARVDYRLVGPIEPDEAARLKALAAGSGWRGLSIEGRADEDELASALEAADVIACLRRPVLEGASASVAEAMLSGRPTLVADAGCYADLPDDTVVKVGADTPVAELRAALERLAADEPGRRALGARAREEAERRFSLEAYLDVLEPLMRATAAAAPILRMSRGLGGRCSPSSASPTTIPQWGVIAATLAPVFLAPQPGLSQGAEVGGRSSFVGRRAAIHRPPAPSRPALSRRRPGRSASRLQRRPPRRPGPARPITWSGSVVPAAPDRAPAPARTESPRPRPPGSRRCPTRRWRPPRGRATIAWAMDRPNPSDRDAARRRRRRRRADRIGLVVRSTPRPAA